MFKRLKVWYKAKGYRVRFAGEKIDTTKRLLIPSLLTVECTVEDGRRIIALGCAWWHFAGGLEASWPKGTGGS